MSFLPLNRWLRWSVCAGSAALEAVEPLDWPEPVDTAQQARDFATQLLIGKPVELPADLAESIRLFVAAVHARRDQCKAAGATVELKVAQRLDVSAITGEKSAIEVADAVLIAEYKEHATLDVFRLALGETTVTPQFDGELRILGLAALLKYGILQSFTDVGLTLTRLPKSLEWRMNPDDLYVFGATVTEQASLALSLRDDVSALSHLTAGEVQCMECSARYRCPALAVKVADKVIEQTEVPDAPPLSLTERLDDPAILQDALAILPLVENWCQVVRGKAAPAGGARSLE